MPLWPFGRKKRRTSSGTATTTATTTTTTEKTAAVSDFPAQATARPPSRRSSRRKRKPAASQPPPAHDTPAAVPVPAPVPAPEPEAESRRGSVRLDMTALPALAKLEPSPHLRPAHGSRPVHPYNLDRPSSPRSVRNTAAGAVSDPRSTRNPQSTTVPTGAPRKPATNPQNRPKEQALREEEIRQMSAPMQIPKRPAGSANDLLRRDSKKARRTLSKRQDSTVSLPLQDTIDSSMSATVEQRAWEIGGMSALSPRPTVRLSNAGSNAKTPRNKDKLPELARSSSRKDRRKVADLADDLDSSELRVLMERDSRRQERKAQEQHDRLDRKLRKRAEKQHAEEERRARESQQHVVPPIAIHPAFRNQQDEAGAVLFKREGKKPDLELERGRSPSQRHGTYLRYPPRGDLPQNPFVDPEPETSNPFTTPAAEYYSPVQTPMEDPVLETARAVRLSVSHISPPSSPVPKAPETFEAQPRPASNLPTSPPAPTERRTSETSTRRTGAWASIFRRGASASRASEDSLDRSSPSKLSFVNTSRESMSKQPIPAHLVQQPSTRHSGAPVRTQSKFREDLPELPTPPSSRVQSPELSIIAANVAAARRAKRTARQAEMVPNSSPDVMSADRTDSPVILEDQPSTILSRSFASIDSEGSWISGRPLGRSSRSPQPRSRSGSSAKPRDDFSASFDRLPVPEHEYFVSLTPEGGSRRPSGEQTVEVAPSPEGTHVDAPLRKGTARRRPTVVHNDPRFKSREGLLAQYEAGEAIPLSREGSTSGESAGNSPIELQKASSVNYGRSLGHVKSLSAGSARLLDISSGRSRSLRTSPNSSPHLA